MLISILRKLCWSWASRRRQPKSCEGTAISIEGNNPLALSNLGRLLSEMGDPALLAEAENVCRRDMELARDTAPLASTLAKVLIRLGPTE